MGPKPNTQTGSTKKGSKGGGGVCIGSDEHPGITGVLVEDMLLDEAYDRYLNSFHNSYDLSQVKAFYCAAERQSDNVSFVCPFKNCVVTLTLGR